MTLEQKDLLLKDLCARLPYDVKVEYDNYAYEVLSIDRFHEELTIWKCPGYYPDVKLEDVKPYLFPISSITEEQWKEITDIQIKESLKSIDSNNDYMSNPLFSIGDLKTLDWCYANHIDYRGLIPMGLAKDATGLNIY